MSRDGLTFLHCNRCIRCFGKCILFLLFVCKLVSPPWLLSSPAAEHWVKAADDSLLFSYCFGSAQPQFGATVPVLPQWGNAFTGCSQHVCNKSGFMHKTPLGTLFSSICCASPLQCLVAWPALRVVLRKAFFSVPVSAHGSELTKCPLNRELNINNSGKVLETSSGLQARHSDPVLVSPWLYLLWHFNLSHTLGAWRGKGYARPEQASGDTPGPIRRSWPLRCASWLFPSELR